MKNQLISVIVPVYNVVKYLEKCIFSISSQTYKDIEIIIVDDGAKDGSGVLADKLALSDQRIVVIHKSNGGLSSARNAGLDVAHGEYILFVDADDYIEPNMCEVLYLYAIKYNSQLVECGIIKEFSDRIVADFGRVFRKYNGRDAVFEYLKKHDILRPLVWDSLYHISIFDDIRFDEGRLHEDGWFKYKALYKATTVCIIPECLYYYVLNRDGSIMTVPIKEKNIRDIIDAFEYRWLFFEKGTDKELEELAKAAYCKELLSYYYVVNDKLVDQDAVKRLSNEIIQKLEVQKEFVSVSKYIDDRRVKFWFFYHFRQMTKLLSKIRYCFFKYW